MQRWHSYQIIIQIIIVANWSIKMLSLWSLAAKWMPIEMEIHYFSAKTCACAWILQLNLDLILPYDIYRTLCHFVWFQMFCHHFAECWNEMVSFCKKKTITGQSRSKCFHMTIRLFHTIITFGTWLFSIFQYKIKRMKGSTEMNENERKLATVLGNDAARATSYLQNDLKNKWRAKVSKLII